MKRRIISLLTALVLIFSCCFISTGILVSAVVEDCTLSNPVVGSTANQLKFTGTSTTVPSGVSKQYKADNTIGDGIYIDGALVDKPIIKAADNSWSIKGLTVATNMVITVKGTFTYEGNSVRFNTITVKYNGSAWGIIENPNFDDLTSTENDRVFQLQYIDDTIKYGGANGIYLLANDSLAYDHTWSTALSFDDGDDNGVFLNGQKKDSVVMKKVGANAWYVDLAAATLTAQIDDEITLKGAITHNGKTAVFNEATFVFDGTTWAAKTNKSSAKFTLDYQETNPSMLYGDKNGIYLTSDDVLNHLGWETAIPFDLGDDNGVFVNGTKTNVFLKKYAADSWYVCLNDNGYPAEIGDVVVVKGAITQGTNTVVFDPIAVVFDGVTWYLTDDPNLETGRSLSLDVQTGVPPVQEGIYLIGDDSLEAPGWEKEIIAYPSDDSGVFVNGVKTDIALKKYEGNKWFLSLSDRGYQATENTVVKVKGTFTYGDYRIAFNEDEFIFNGTTWVTKTNSYTTTLDFVDLLSISKFNTTTGKWEIYLSTTTPLPGNDESTTLDVSMKIGDSKETITCKKSSQQHSFAFELDSSLVPQNSQTEVCVIVRGGKYDVKGDSSKVKIENDIALYFVNGQVSLNSINIPYDEKDITLKIDRTAEGGGTTRGIYLTATDNVPYATDWSVITNAYEGKTNGVFLNGVKTNVFLKKYDKDKYYVCLSDVNLVPKEGDRITVKGAFETNGYISSYNEYSLVFIDGLWVDGTEPETNYTTVNIISYEDSISRYNNDSNRWEIYFATKEKLPGNADQVFNFVTATINGKDYSIPCYHAGHNDTFFIIIESDKLAKDATAEVKISGKAKSADQLIGMDVVPFTFYVNKYGISLEGYVAPIEIKETGVTLSLDTTTFNWMAGTQSGIYLLTTDNFEVDKTWQTPIRAIGYDDNSGVFYNDKKIDAVLKKYTDGQIYLDIAAAGVFAKDKDKITIKGTFALNGYGVSYNELTLYYNGQSWGTTYTMPLPKTTTKLNITGIRADSGYNSDRKEWIVYIKVDGDVPGERDHEFKSLVCEANGETFDVRLYKAGDCLVFFIPESVMPKDTKHGTTIKLKGGLISDNYELYDIDLSGELLLYTFYTSISQNPPTNNTKYSEITVPGLLRTCKYVEELKAWQIFFKVEEEFDVDDGTEYFNLPVKLNGKMYDEIRTFRSGESLYVYIPESVLPKDAETATLTIDKGAKAVANSGWNGIRFKKGVEIYLFAGVWNNVKFTEYKDTDLIFKHLNSSNYNSQVSRWDIYLNVDREVPGENWFEVFEGLTVYLNGKEYTTYANKAESANNRLMYISLDEATFGEFKEGDVVHFPKGITYSCGGYRINNVQDFYLQYTNGTWFEYYKTNVKAPEAEETIWENSRIDGYIPVQEEKGVMFTNVPPTNVIKTVEDVKDVTIKFDVTKMLAFNEELPTNSIILRGQPLTEGMEISETALYGYNISFAYIELNEDRVPNNPELWGVHSQEISVWKNGINYALLDQYRMTYNWKKTNHPFFEYDKTYEYTISIYNVEEDICFIEIFCNDELIMRVVDRASDDEMDPARNAGQVQIYASCPQYLYSPEVELDKLEVSKSECYIGEQVRVSATYPAILEGAEYTVEGEGATIKDGVFIATKAGTYTVSGTYNGVSKGTVQIKVSEKPITGGATEEASTFPIIPVAIGGGVAVIAAAAVSLVIFLKKKKV